MKIIQIVLLLFFASIYCSCTNNDHNKIKIGFIFDNMSALRWVKEKAYFIEKVENLGAELIIRSADGMAVNQEKIADEMIDLNIDILVIIANNVNSAASIVRKAHANNIKVIAYDRLIRNTNLDLYISFDNIKVGELMAKYMIIKVPKGNYLLINGDKSDNNAVAVNDGIMKVLKPYVDAGSINIVYSGFMEDWSGNEAKYYTNKVIQFSDKELHAVISSYDGLTDGVVETLERYGLEKIIPVTGQDAEIDACKRLLTGKQIMTIYKPGKELAYKCAEIAYKLAKNIEIKVTDTIFNGRENIPTILLNPIVVDKENIQSTIIKDGLFTWDEIKN